MDNTYTVTFSDGEIQDFITLECMIEAIELVADCGVLPSRIVDSNGTSYYCEWSVNVIPCPVVKKEG